MTWLYREVLRNVLFLPDQIGGLALVAEAEQPQGPGKPGSLPIPDDLFPKGCEVYHLPSGETFVDSIPSIITDARPRRLFLIPPFASSRHLSKELHARFGGLSLEEIAFCVALEALDEKALLGSILSLQSLAGESSQLFRKRISSNATLRLVLEHNHSWQEFGLEVDLPLKVATLLVEAGESSSPTLRFFKCPEVPSSDKRERALSDLRRLMKQGGGQTEYGYVLREGLAPGEKLLFDRYDPELIQRQEDMAHLGDVRPLSNMVEIRKGFPRLRTSELITKKRHKFPQAIPAITGRNLRADGSLELEDIRYWVSKEVPTRFKLEAGDICLRTIVGNVAHMSVAKVEEYMLPLVALDSVIVLRAKPSTTHQEQDLLAAYLGSDRAMEWLSAQRTGVYILPSQLEELPIPVPDKELSLALRSLRESVDQLDSWKKEAQQALNSLFNYRSARNARLHVLSTGRTTRQRAEAGSLVDDPRYRIRTQYPHPIAYRWRGLEATRPNLEGYLEVLECAEVAVCYLACAAVAIAESSDEEILWVGEMSRKLSSESKGTSMGDWISILREVRDSKQLRRTNTPFLYEVVQFLGDDQIDGALQWLKDSRDDQAHGRGPKALEVERFFQQGFAKLELLLRGAEFLSDYPLRYVENTTRDSIQKVTYYEYRDLVGDHPLVPLKKERSEEAEVEAGSLYLVDRTRDLYLLRPLLSRRQCPQCYSWATFYLDTYDRKQRVCTLKSMERGHTVVDSDIVDAFQYVGLLRPD